MHRHRLTFASVFVVAIAGLGLALTIAQSPLDGKGRGTGPQGTIVPRAEYESAVATARAGVKPQLDYLQEFNSGKRDFAKLPVQELEGLLVETGSFEATARSADLAAVVRVKSVHFGASDLADMPAMTITYVVEQAAPSALQRAGDEIVVSMLGGPYRVDLESEVFILLPRIAFPAIDSRVVFLARRLDSGQYTTVDAGSMFTLDASGKNIVADDASTRAGIAGHPVGDVMARAAAARR